MAKHTPERIAEIRSHLIDLDRRGVPVAVYTEEIGVTPWTIYSWRRRFAGTGGIAAEQSSAEVADARADLVEFHGPITSSTIEIRIGEVVIHVQPGADAESVGAVVRAVKSC